MKKRESGFVLIGVLLVMIMLMLVGTILLTKSTSELRQSSNSYSVTSARALAEAGQSDAFYLLANSGLQTINNIFKPFSTSFASSQSDPSSIQIIPNSNISTILTSLNSSFSPTTNNMNGGSYTYDITFQSLRPDIGSFSKTGQSYFLDYRVDSNSTQGLSKRNVITQGTLVIAMGRQSLNQFVFLADDGGSGSSGTSGFFDTSSVYDGPVHVNKNWALSGKPTFLAGATTAGNFIWMNDSRDKKGNCSGFAFVKVIGQQASPSACTQPNTNNRGITYGVEPVNLPNNAFSQQNAALGLDASTNTATNAQICSAIGSTNPNCSVSDGTYIPNSNGQVTGGIFIKGDAKVVLSTATNAQIYKITDSKNVVTTVTVNYATKTTTYSSNGVNKSYQGTMNGQLYSTSKITSLTGPPRTANLPSTLPINSVPSVVPPAIASQSQLNIAAASTVNIDGDLVYTDDPRTNSSAQNVLGIISGTDNIVISDVAPNDIYIQAAMLAGSTGDGLSVKSPGRQPARGAIHMFGSLAEATDQLRGQVNNDGTAIAGYADDFHFDQRFTNGGVAPPFFPATTKFIVSTGWPIQRTWEEQ